MRIDEVKLTDEELTEAVHMWLTSKGVSLSVEQVRKQYSYSSEWTVTFKEPEEPKPKLAEIEPLKDVLLDTAKSALPESDPVIKE